MTQPFACDGRVDTEKLSELLAVQTETEALDYKKFIDLTNTRGRVEFAKDVGAMQSLSDGGYIIVGVDGYGKPTAEIGIVQAEAFDEQKVRAALRKYLDEPFTIRSQVHVVENVSVALIYIGPNEQGFAVFSQDGQYKDDLSGKSATSFRKGDVYSRHGSSSEPWNQADLPRIFHALQARIREEERARLGDAFQVAQQSMRGNEISQGPIGSLSWQLTATDFQSAILEAVRAKDRVVLRTTILSISATVESKMRLHYSENADDIETLIDRLAIILATAITHEEKWLFNTAVDSFSKIYWSTAGDEYGHSANGLTFIPAKLWLRIGITIEAAGALALRMTALWAIRPLILVNMDGSKGYITWLRHSLTRAAEANLLVGNSGKYIPGSFIGFSRQVAARIDSLRPDIPDDVATSFEIGVAPQHYDPLLDSIIQFDLIWCVVAYQYRKNRSDFYPNFSGFYARRAAPALRLITQQSSREAIFPGVGEKDLHDSLETVFNMAKEQSWQTSLMGDWHLDVPQL